MVGEHATPVPAAVKARLVALSMNLRRRLSAIKVPEAFAATAKGEDSATRVGSLAGPAPSTTAGSAAPIAV